MIFAMLIMEKIRFKETDTHKIRVQDFKDLFSNKKYILLSLGCFLVGGSIIGNNNYFGLLYTKLGGSIAGIGLAFLLFAGSEAPFMDIYQKISGRINLIYGLIIVSVFSALRWFIYSLHVSPKILLLTFVLQGISVGGYLVLTTLYVAKITDEKVRTTALSLFGALSMGLGGMVLQFVAGKIMSIFGISHVYTFFFGMNILAIYIFTRLLNKD